VECLILLAEILGLGSGVSDQSIAGVNDFLTRVAAGDSKFALSDSFSLDRLSFLHPRVLSGRDQRSGGKDGEGVDHTPPNILVGGGGSDVCVDGELGVLPDFAHPVASGDGEAFLGGLCGGVVCGCFSHARALVL